LWKWTTAAIFTTVNEPILIAATAKQVEAIYFKDGAFDVFESPATRRARRGSLWVTPIAGAFILYAMGQPNSTGLISMATTVLIGQTVILGFSFHNLNKQRQRVVDFARATEKGGPAELRTTDIGFSLTFKGAEHIERWINVQSATVAEDHIALFTTTNYLFPKASMTETQFVELCAIIRKQTLLDNEAAEAQAAGKRPIGFRNTE
jgi:hypothetical protein